MSSRPSARLRRQVAARAGNCCEYCLAHQDVGASTHQIDHVIAEKHGGLTASHNLALSCTSCNRRKGSDISSVDPLTGITVPLFNPRTQRWADHFQLDGVSIIGRSPEGRATISLLELNSYERTVERYEWMAGGAYPPHPHRDGPESLRSRLRR